MYYKNINSLNIKLTKIGCELFQYIGVGSTAHFFGHVIKFTLPGMIWMCFGFIKKNLKKFENFEKPRSAPQKTDLTPKNHIIFDFST